MKFSSIGPVTYEDKMFENVDGQRTDAGVTGILIAHLGAFGSGELKKTIKNNGPYHKENLILMHANNNGADQPVHLC